MLVMELSVLCVLMISHALAQDATSTASSQRNASATASTSTVSLFLPMHTPEQIQASIISASPNQTAYALGCTNNDTTTACAWNPPITVTEGESTIIYTNTHRWQEDFTYDILHMTMQCELFGAHTTENPFQGATSAVCVGSSAVSGLGVVVTTSTLASTQLGYVPVTITAGMQKIMEASRSAAIASATTSTSAAGAPMITAMAKLGVGGIAGMAILGAL
ncbi:hypothetical protein AC578_3841 [Pseudocercospora eumusae]|uniref:Uncharacterized protein n=1 Tax=Pseudocercospora eumusae TaxID=321146 RepID=A0A139GU62_9PEZI|nr:hypothetical protein AC578_3841 [Pseudocercospora eumusae]KXS93707.1 hypothetical protein AC578_3841 [Pseudocercospora eumusae]